ncbi:MAG: hypothetical protein ABIK31_07105, partial [candidate division WOR-3 bacterium]
MQKSIYLRSIFVLLIITLYSLADTQDHSLSSTFQLDIINTPKLLNYQGKLTNLAGNPLPDSTYSITFRLFNSQSGGSAFWTETQNVQTNGGIFNVLLG